MRLLLVEDNQRLAGLTIEGLARAGFETDHMACAEDADAALQTQFYDLVVLDLGLPGRDGISLLQELRNMKNKIPVLILTARDTLEDKVRGLNEGADDYLLKPFAIEELVARIRALLRRPGNALSKILNTGNISFNTDTRSTQVADKPLTLSRREIDLLEQLLRATGQVVTKDIIESRLYGFGAEGSANSIEVLMHRLRRKLEMAGANVEIHTLRGIGYLLAETGNNDAL